MDNEEEFAVLTMTDEDGRETDFYVLERTTLGGETYLLMTDHIEDEEAEACIFHELQAEDDEEIVYEIVEDDALITALSPLFEELLEDVDITTE